MTKITPYYIAALLSRSMDLHPITLKGCVCYRHSNWWAMPWFTFLCHPPPVLPTFSHRTLNPVNESLPLFSCIFPPDPSNFPMVGMQPECQHQLPALEGLCPEIGTAEEEKKSFDSWYLGSKEPSPQSLANEQYMRSGSMFKHGKGAQAERQKVCLRRPVSVWVTGHKSLPLTRPPAQIIHFSADERTDCRHSTLNTITI